MAFITDILGDVVEFRELFGVPDFVLDSRLLMCLRIATIEVKNFAGESKYADATVDPPEDVETRDALVMAEYHFAFAKLLLVTGITNRVDLGKALIEALQSIADDFTQPIRDEMPHLNPNLQLDLSGLISANYTETRELAKLLNSQGKAILKAAGISMSSETTPATGGTIPIDQDG